MKLKLLGILSLSLLFCLSCFAQNLQLYKNIQEIPSSIEKSTMTFIKRDTLDLKMDVYKLKSEKNNVQPCMFFVFGGGFFIGTRDMPYLNRYFIALAEQGITVISIDYRLGLVGAKKISPFRTKPLEKAIKMAVEDLFAATKYTLEHAKELKIDPKQIMISGSSAGAITVLHADYIKRNNLAGAEVLPSDFQYSAVLSYAGAIMSRVGKPKYDIKPAPTLFFHGEKDQLVVYNQIRLFNKGFFGSKSLAKNFSKQDYPYCFYSVENVGHTMAATPMINYNDLIIDFINEYVYNQKPWEMTVEFKDMSLKPEVKSKISDLYKTQ